MLFKHQLLPYMAHTKEFLDTQNFTKCAELLNEITTKYMDEDIRDDEIDLNSLKFNNIPEDVLKLYDYCGQNVKEWIDKLNKNIKIVYFSKSKYDILNCRQMDVIETYNKKSKHKIEKRIIFSSITYGDEGLLEPKPIDYTGDIGLFLDSGDTVIKEIKVDNQIIYNGCSFIFRNLISDKLSKYFNQLDDIIFSKISEEKKDLDEKLEIMDDIIDIKIGEIQELRYFNEYIFSDFRFNVLIYKKLPKVYNYLKI